MVSYALIINGEKRRRDVKASCEEYKLIVSIFTEE
jgi:hypothetical protein